MEVDASGVGLSATLVQQQQDGMVWPIAYSSRTLQQHEKHRVTEMETLGVMWVVKHFWHYLYGHHCHVFTNHEPLKSLLTISQESITKDGESSSSLSPVLSELEKSSVGKK